jgi:glutamine amidotransferase
MIAIIDYGMGNLGSVFNMFKKIGAEAIITSDPDKIYKASKILLPGVGAFDTAMNKINNSELLPLLNEKALVAKIPILGICLGMQLLTHGSDEGLLPGLGWIEGQTISFKGKLQNSYKIPHMGWNSVNFQTNHKILEEFEGDISFYFVHSYYVKVMSEKNSLMKTQYDINFDSAIFKDNIFGAQFHPEKSHKYGMQLFKNFVKL